MQKSTFRTFLETTYRPRALGGRLTPRAVSDCISRAARLESILAIDLDKADFSERGLAAIIERFRSKSGAVGINDNARRDCVAALRRYAAFRQHVTSS